MYSHPFGPGAGPTAPQPDSGLTVPPSLSRHASVASTNGSTSHVSATSSTPIIPISSSRQATATTTQTGNSNSNATSVNVPAVPPPAGTPPTGSQRSVHSQNAPPCEEWCSWKIHWLYLSLLLLTTVLFVAGITTVTVISHLDNGFARESQPPGFLRDRPGLRKAIWEQGIFYTALPAFIMTIYRTMFDASVMSVADRQPFVDLLKEGGRAARRTILLDYKMEPILYRWILAYRNKHFILSACMLTSLVLSFVIVPLTSFLFTMDSSESNSTFALTVDTYFDPNIKPVIPGFDNMPNIRLVLDTASSFHLHSLGLPPNTDGIVAIPHFTRQGDLGSSTLILQVDAYGVDSGCIEIPESEYNKTIQNPGPETISIHIDVQDRKCAVSGQLDVRTSPWSPEIFATSKFTPSCEEDAGWSRISVAAARYNRASHTVQNLTFISCRTSYFNTSGELFERSEPKLSPRLLYFNESKGDRRYWSPLDSFMIKVLLEKEIHGANCVGPGRTIEGNEFAKNIYQMAQQASPDAPLKADALVNATAKLYETVYAVYSSLFLFKRLDKTVNETGVYMIEEKRLFIVPAVAYVVLGVLGVTAILTICLFHLARQKSILREEPFSILGYAGIVHKSEDIKYVVSETAGKDSDPRRARERARKIYKLEDPELTWRYNEGKIMIKGPLEMR